MLDEAMGAQGSLAYAEYERDNRHDAPQIPNLIKLSEPHFREKIATLGSRVQQYAELAEHLAMHLSNATFAPTEHAWERAQCAMLWTLRCKVAQDLCGVTAAGLEALALSGRASEGAPAPSPA